jgi:hypothetical protein
LRMMMAFPCTNGFRSARCTEFRFSRRLPIFSDFDTSR